MAEGVGFEPTDPYGSPVFKTGAFNRSAIPPLAVFENITSTGLRSTASESVFFPFEAEAKDELK
jgi:hypothetical protein